MTDERREDERWHPSADQINVIEGKEKTRFLRRCETICFDIHKDRNATNLYVGETDDALQIIKHGYIGD